MTCQDRERGEFAGGESSHRRAPPAKSASARLVVMNLASAPARRAGLGRSCVPGKAELLELMVDRVASTQPFPVQDAGCRAGLHDLATADLVAYRARPLAVAGRGVAHRVRDHIGRYDAALALLAGSGLAAIAVAGCIAAVKSYTRSAAGAVVEAEQAPAATGSSAPRSWPSAWTDSSRGSPRSSAPSR